MIRIGAIQILVWLCAAVTFGQALAQDGISRESAAAGHTLTVTAERASIQTTDRLTVCIELRSAIGSAEPVLAFDPGEAGWREVARESTAYRLAEDGQSRARTWMITLEPFLPGPYSIPPVELALGDGRTLASESIEIEVGSVLTTPDESAQEELTAWRSEEATTDQVPESNRLPVVIIVCVVMLGAVVAVRGARRRGGPEAAPVIEPAQLRSAKAVRTIGVEVALANLSVAARSSADGALASEIERARFSGETPEAEQVAELAIRLHDAEQSRASR